MEIYASILFNHSVAMNFKLCSQIEVNPNYKLLKEAYFVDAAKINKISKS